MNLKSLLSIKESLQNAVAKDDLDALETILQNKETIPHQYIEEAYILAAKIGQFRCIVHFDFFVTIPNQTYADALFWATRQNHKEIVAFLSKKIKDDRNIGKPAICAAFKSASRHSLSNIEDALLTLEDEVLDPNTIKIAHTEKKQIERRRSQEIERRSSGSFSPR